MATPVQRLQAIADAYLNRVATPAELKRIGDAVAFMNVTPDYESMTNSEKARVVVEHLFRTTLQTVKHAEKLKAEALAAATPDPDFNPTP